MNILGDIERDHPHLGHLLHPDRQERLMTTPQPRTQFADAAARITAAASNRLIVELAEHGLGALLNGGEINTICTLIATLERPRAQRGTEPQPETQVDLTLDPANQAAAPDAVTPQSA